MNLSPCKVSYLHIIRPIHAVNATADIPRPLKITVTNTLSNWYSWGLSSNSTVVDDICQTGLISPPDVDSAGYSCPNAGVYNFHFTHDIWGSDSAWYSSWSGFTQSIVVHLQHEGGGKDYAMCHLDVSVKKSADSSFAKTTYFVAVASLGVTGLLAGIFIRKRKEKVHRCGRISVEEDEMASNFELVQDNITV